MTDDATAAQRLVKKLEDFVDALDDEERLWMKVVFDRAVAGHEGVDQDEVTGHVLPMTNPAVTESMMESTQRVGAMQDLISRVNSLSETIHARSLGASKG